MAYKTSDLYKEAIDELSRTTHISGTLTTEKGKVIDITNDIIDTGSLYITNQCVNSDVFEYGSVFAAEAGITLKTEVDRYSLFNAVLVLNFNILLSNSTYETIPLGKFYVIEPNRVGKSITMKCYDEMVNLDVPIAESTTGTVFDLLMLLSSYFGFELAQTQEEIEALPNAKLLLSVSQEKVGTYRDLLSYIGKITCTFAHFDREGKLRLTGFSKEINKQIDAKLRSSSSFSDFQTYYSKATAKFLVSGAYETYTSSIESDGLEYNFNEVPIVQGLDESNQAVIDAMFEELKTINYTPCDITFNGDPSIDLGDMIKNVDRAGNEIISLVTFYKWTFRGRHQIKSAGSNPKLASLKEKSNVDTSYLEGEIHSKTVSVYTFTNASKITAKGGTDLNIKTMKEIVKISFTSEQLTTSLLITTINFTLDNDGIVEFESYIDNVYMEQSRISQFCLKGENVITFMNYISCEENKTYRLSIYCKTKSKESIIQYHDAKIKTFDNANTAIIGAYESIVRLLKEKTELPFEGLSDTIEYNEVKPVYSTPTIYIAKQNIKLALFGQGLAGKADWDGTIACTDDASLFDIDTSQIKGVIDAMSKVEAIKQVPISNGIVERVSPISIGHNIQLKGAKDVINVSTVVTNYTFETEKANLYEFNSEYVKVDESYHLNTEYEYNSVEQSMGTGKMCSVKIMTSDKDNIQEVVIS